MTRVGIVGCGTLARTLYLKSLPQVPGVQVRAVSDVDDAAARRTAALYGARVCDLDSLGKQVDAVIVSTPPSTHYAIVSTLLERAAMVVCEKPFVGLASEARQLIRLAETQGSRLYVGHLRRLFPGVALARQLVSSGVLGELRRVDICEGARFSWDAVSGYTRTDPMGGVLFDTGSHAIDTALFICGLDDQVEGVDVLRVRHDKPEPSHEIEAVGRVHGAGRSLEFRLLLSRREALANRIRLELDGGSIVLPVDPRDRVRIKGKAGDVVIAGSGGGDLTYEEVLVRQWTAMFSKKDDAVFEASRFLGVTQVLEAVSKA